MHKVPTNKIHHNCKEYTVKMVKSGDTIEVYCYKNKQYKRAKNSNIKTLYKKTVKKVIINQKEEPYTRQEGTVNRSIRNLRRLIDANLNQFKNTDKFITLTFSEAPDRNELLHKFKVFNKRLSRIYSNYKYIAVIERGTKNTKRLHLHCLFFNLPYIERNLFQAIWEYGIVYIEKIDEYPDLARYLTKYLSKTLIYDDYIPKGKKAYIASQGLVKPIEEYMDEQELITELTPLKDEYMSVYHHSYDSEHVGMFDYHKLKPKKKERVKKDGSIQR